MATRKPAKRSRKLPQIRLANRSPSPPGPSTPSTSLTPRTTQEESWITTVKNPAHHSRLTFTTQKHIHESSSPVLAVQHPQSGVHKDPISTDESLTSAIGCQQPSVPVHKRKRKREHTAKSHLVQWLELRDLTLDELLRHDGMCSSTEVECSHCGTKEAFYRCRDCGHGTKTCCRKCLISNHHDLELHRVEFWNGNFFEKTSLASLGLRVQLGHDGRPCPCPLPGPPGFLVFDITGVHHVNVDFCDCNLEHPLERRIQLLRKQWFPATLTRPKTVFTFNCLDTFHESTLQGKGNLYDFYHMLIRKTDNANLKPTIYRFLEIHRIFRLWRNMMAWKRAGRGQDPAGIDGTAPGELTPSCPACPHPGRNLPDDWKNAGPLLYLYTLFLAIDGNFKLKGKNRKLQDVDLLGATGVFVDEQAYQEHIKNYVDQPEVNTCRSQHDAIVRASCRSTPGYSVSGVGIVICSRHLLVRKVGDFQKGEKYCNIDFIAFSVLAVLGLIAHVVITYDIACQWSKNFRKRMDEFPANMQMAKGTTVRTAIPSWHIEDHGPTCHRDFNLAYMEGVGRTCGEEVEVTWSHTNPLAASVREMAPEARHDALNDHWSSWNFRRIVGFRKTFSRKFKEAASMQEKHKEIFDQFSATFPHKVIKEWTTAVEKWEADPTAPNPYEEPADTTSVQDIRLELAKEEAAEVSEGNIPMHKVSKTGFLITGLVLEDRQYQLRVEVSNRKQNSAKQQADIQEKRTALLRQIHNWRQAQLVYTPDAANLVAASPSVDESGLPRVEAAEDVPLFMPSALPAYVRSTPAVNKLCNMEIRLRKAQANDALHEIRRGRRNVRRLWKYKKVNVSGTGNRPNTRMITLYNRISNKIERAAHKYRRAWSALVILDPDGTWKETLRELCKEDIRGPGKEPNESKTNRTSNGRFEEAWIWIVQRGGKHKKSEEEEYNEDMRLEWMKSRARTTRWKEEHLLLQEEMRRILAWFEWKATWWEKQASLRESGDPEVLGGVKAYSHKQASIARQMAKRCADEWLPLLMKHGVEPQWASYYATNKADTGSTGMVGDEDVEEAVDDDDAGGLPDVHSDEEGEEGEEEDDFDDFEFDD